VIEKMLRQYPLFKKSLEEERKGVFLLFLSLTPRYRIEQVQGGKIGSTTERYGIKRADKRLLVEQVDSCLEVLNDEERRLVEEAYFCSVRPPMDIIYDKLGVSRPTYYRIRDRAFQKIAMLLNLI
jgi:ArpU family phage transcriptional regulator